MTKESKFFFFLLIGLVFSCARINPQLKNLSYDDKLTYYSVEKIAAKEELVQYLNCSPQERKEWLRRFWKKLDPTPTTEKNEFKEEHDRRVEYAFANFRTTFGNRPWDQRGEIYIIYGKPDERSLNIEASSKDYRTENWSEEKQREKREKFIARKTGVIPLDTEEEFYKTCGEVWIYDKYNLVFQFEDEHFVGHYSLVPYTKFDGNAETPQELDVKKAISVEKQKEIYKYDYGGEALDFAFDLLKFREKKNNYDVDLNLGIPLDYLQRDDSSRIEVLRRITLLDENMEQLKADSETITKSVDAKLEPGYLLIEQWQCKLPSGKYTLAVEIRDLNSKKIGIYKKDFILPAYAFPGTQEISNLVMASDIRPANRYQTKYVKHDLVVLPMPSKVYRPDEMIYFYYEVYNLKKDNQGKARYTVHYSLVDYKNKKEISFYEPKTFQTDKSDIFQHAEIDGSTIPPGEYALAVRITDINRNMDKITLTGFRIVGK